VILGCSVPVVNKLTDSDSLSGLIENWRLARKCLNQTGGDLEAETAYNLSAVIMRVLQDQIANGLDGSDLKVKTSNKGVLNYAYSIRILDLVITLRVLDKMQCDDGDRDEEEEDEPAFVASGYNDIDLSDTDSTRVVVWHERTIYIHVKYSSRLFFWGSIECVFDEEKSDEVEVMSTDLGEDASMRLIHICRNIK